MIHLLARRSFAALFLLGSLFSALAAPPADFSGYTAVGLIRGRQNHLIAHGKIASRTAIFLLDTGAPVTCIDSTKQRRFGLLPVVDRTSGPMTVIANGHAQAVTVIPELSLGTASLSNTPALLIDLTEQNRWSHAFSDTAIDGILGANELFTEKALVDCRNQRLLLKKDPQLSATLGPALRHRGWQELDLWLDHGHLIVNGKVNKIPVRFIVDTGASMTNLDRAFCLANHITLSRHKYISGGIHMKDPASRLAQVNLRYGTCDIGPAIMGVSDISMLLDNSKSSSAPPLVGLLGCDILESNSAIIDFERMKLYMKQSSNTGG